MSELSRLYNNHGRVFAAISRNTQLQEVILTGNCRRRQRYHTVATTRLAVVSESRVASLKVDRGQSIRRLERQKIYARHEHEFSLRIANFTRAHRPSGATRLSKDGNRPLLCYPTKAPAAAATRPLRSGLLIGAGPVHWSSRTPCTRPLRAMNI